MATVLFLTYDVLFWLHQQKRTSETEEVPATAVSQLYRGSGPGFMMSNITNQCKDFRTLHSFDAYVDTLRDAFGKNFTSDSLSGCRDEICTTLYSTENSDISGIGVVIGYFLEFGLGFFLALAMLVLNRLNCGVWKVPCRKITKSYADCAIALALSVELAAATMLIKKNFGLGANDFGGFTVQVTWMVALLVMLPIVNFCWQDLQDKRSELRLCVVALVWILFLITFLCRMISSYSKKDVGSGDNAAITNREENAIENLCLGKLRGFSRTESIVVDVFSIAGSLWVLSVVAAALIRDCLRDSNLKGLARLQRQMFRPNIETTLLIVNVAALLVFSVPLFWALMSLRRWQDQFAEDLGQHAVSKQWSFGQILAVVVFVPVLLEAWNQYLRRHDLPKTDTIEGAVVGRDGSREAKPG